MKAFYDQKPLKLEPVGNGSYLYRWDIAETEQQFFNGEETETRTQWECQETTVWMPISSNRITEAVIGELWDSNYEQKLINEYNSANLGVYDETVAQEKITAYKEFLTSRNAIKEQVDKDCKELGIN